MAQDKERNARDKVAKVIREQGLTHTFEEAQKKINQILEEINRKKK